MFGPARNIPGIIAGLALALAACGGDDSTPVTSDAACEADGCVVAAECPPGTRGDPAVACMEVDACEEHPCGVGALCVDLPAPAPTTAEGRTCACDEGFEGDPVLGCTDIDACVNHACGANATCTDRPAPALDDVAGRSCA